MISDNIQYVGVNDHELALFEGQYNVPNGMAYNSYVISDEKIAVVDSVEVRFAEEWLNKIQTVLGEKAPDYLIVQHMEPDHSSSILRFMERWPEATIVASARAFVMMKNFYGNEFTERRIVAGDGDTLSLGSRTLTFVSASMVHWPEVVVTYDAQDRVLFSADAFGKFGALDVEEEWLPEARRYYIGIVGKYGAPVQALLKKAAGLDIQTICPLHGPVLTENLGFYLDRYQTWSTYGVEEDGVVLAYTSVYGNTKQAVEQMAEKLREKGCGKVVVHDLARCDLFEAVADAFRFGKVVLATTTYNGDIFPFMKTFLHHLTARGFSNRTVAFIENGSWAPAAIRGMKKILEGSKNLSYVASEVTIRSGLSVENAVQLDALAEELCKAAAPEEAEAQAEAAQKKYVCKICGYEYKGATLPDGFECPLCKCGAEHFEEVV